MLEPRRPIARFSTFTTARRSRSASAGVVARPPPPGQPRFPFRRPAVPQPTLAGPDGADAPADQRGPQVADDGLDFGQLGHCAAPSEPDAPARIETTLAGASGSGVRLRRVV